MKFKKNEEAFLQNARVVRVATADAEGNPHVVPVCPVFDRGVICLGTDASTRKVRNLRQNPRIAVNFDEYTEDWSRLAGMLVQGRTEILSQSSPQFPRIRKLLYEKFPQYQDKEFRLEGKGVLIIRVIPEKVVSWGL